MITTNRSLAPKGQVISSTIDHVNFELVPNLPQKIGEQHAIMRFHRISSDSRTKLNQRLIRPTRLSQNVAQISMIGR